METRISPSIIPYACISPHVPFLARLAPCPDEARKRLSHADQVVKVSAACMRGGDALEGRVACQQVERVGE